jgi:pimeloyl-ACP methyl ester carboxylesterase
MLPLVFALGCSARSDPVDPHRGDVIFLVPGVGGATHQYQGLIDGLHDARIDRPVQIVRWGAPTFLFFLNFNNAGIHESAERALADRVARWREAHPQARIDIIAHSAGCGVTLGALPRLPHERVDTVILLAPSVSPAYDLAPASSRIDGAIHAFVSVRDRTFLEWRTGTFGTYDNVKTAAAGNRGFAALPAGTVQHRYNSAWRTLGHDGGHFGCLARRFARRVIAPLISSPAPLQSSAANPH